MAGDRAGDGRRWDPRTVSAPHRPTMYEFALDGPGSTTVQRLRWRLAEEAIRDERWREVVDPARDAGGLLPEQRRPLRARAPKPGRTMFQGASSSIQAAGLLWVRLLELHEPVLPVTDELEIVAAAAAGEVWLTAHATTNFDAAASLGPDAVSSLAAILARALGEGIEPPETIRAGCAPLGLFDPQPVIAARHHLEWWVRCYENLPRGAWRIIWPKVVADLGAGAVGGTVTSEASLVLLQYHRGRC